MKVVVHADGSVEMEIHSGDGQTALDLIRSLQGVSEVVVEDDSDELLDSAVLSPCERTVYEVLELHPKGCHVSVVAEYLGLSRAITNARLVSLHNRGFTERIAKGTYRLRGEDV